MNKSYILLCFSFCIQSVFAQGKIDTIPFVLTPYNNISIQAVLNQKDTLNLMFHTGVGSVSLTSQAIEDVTSIRFDQKTNVKTWGGENEAKYSKGNTVQIGQFILEDETIWSGELSGHLTDGKFGPNFFGDKILEINFDQNILVLHDQLPKLKDDFSKQTFESRNGMMFLKAKSRIEDQDFENEFLIHSGYSGSFLFDDEFVAKHQFGTLLEVIKEGELKDSYGNVIKTKKAILPFLTLGEATFSDLPIGFFEGAIGRQKMSVMGADILKRFNIIIDSQSSNLYLKPNSLFEMAYYKV